MPAPDESQPVRVPISDELDLHTFAPGDLPELLPAWFEECRKQGLFRVRVIHGKGTGTLRTSVQALLGRLPMVQSWQGAGGESGGWGATIVHLRPTSPPSH